MAETSRFEITVWDSDNDEFSRGQMTLSHNRIEERAAIFRQDELASRGSASTWTRSFFYDETNAILYFSDGTEWQKLTDFGLAASMVAVSPTTPTAAGGGSDQAARIDHRHATNPWGTTTVAVGTSATGGSLNEFARIDHVHVLASNSVTAGTIASGAINNENAFTAGVVKTAAIGTNAVTKEKIATDQQIPTGVIMPYVGATAPDGWLLCDGLPRLKSAYPALWAALSTQNYGSDATNFNTPNLLDRMPRGAATTGTTLGATAGADAVTISTDNMPTHLHGFGSLAVEAHAVHSHTIGGSTGTTIGDHAHSMSHSHTASLASGLVSGAGGFLASEFYFPPGGSGNRYQDGPYSMFDGGSGPQAEIGSASLLSTTVNVSSLSANTGNANLAHSHTLPANTGTLGAAQNHTFSGSTAYAG